MAYLTVTNHSKRYPATSIMAEPYSCDPLGVVGCSAGIEQLKADQSNVGTMIVPAGVFLIDANLTIPITMDLLLMAGASFYINSGKVLSFGSITPLRFQKGRLFTGTGKVSFPNGSFVRTSWIGGLANLATYIYGTPNITLIIDTDETITTNLTLADNYKLSSPFGIVVTISDGVTVTINGPIDKGSPPEFDFLGSGTVVYNGTAIDIYVYPQMWGAAADGTTNDTTAVQSAFDAGEDFNVPVFLPAGVYLCSNLLFGSNTVGSESTGPPQLYGTGGDSILRAIAGTSGVFFAAVNLTGKSLRDFTLDGNNQILVTSVIDTSWYSSGPVLSNRYVNVKIVNYANTGWLGENNNSCDFDFVLVLSPTASTDQKAFDIQASGGPVNMLSCVGEGYLDVDATEVTISGGSLSGLNTAAQTNNLVGVALTSNSVTDACVNGSYGSLVVMGGSMTTAIGHNHIAGTTSTGALLLGVKFDGASGEDIMASGLAGTIGLPIIEFKNCKVTGNATLNYDPCPTGVRVRISSFNINDVSLLDLAATAFITPTGYATPGTTAFTAGPLADELLVFVYAGGGGGAATGGGGGGGGVCVGVLDSSSVTYPVTVIVQGGGAGGSSGGTPNGGLGGTSSFGAYFSATGGGGGIAGAGGAGGAGGVGTGGTANLVGGYGGIQGGVPDGYGGATPGSYGGAPQYTPGGAGNIYGGGGAGATDPGGAGAGGCVVVFEFPIELRWMASLLAGLAK